MPIFILCSCGACLRLHTIAFLSSRLFSFKFSFASSVGASAKITISSRFFFLHIVLSYQGDKHLLSFSTLLPLTQPTAFFIFSPCLLCFSALSFAHIYLYIYIYPYIYITIRSVASHFAAFVFVVLPISTRYGRRLTFLIVCFFFTYSELRRVKCD